MRATGMASIHRRWLWRDLRARAVQVLALSLVIAIGCGVFAGLSNMSAWRQASVDASYEALDHADVHVQLTRGSFTEAGSLAAAIEGTGVAVSVVEERLVAPTLVDASAAAPGDREVLVPGRLVGVDAAAGEPRIDRMAPSAGRALQPGDAARDVVVLDAHFAEYYDLPATTSVRLADGRSVEVVGQVLQPEYFLVTGDGAAVFQAQADFAVAFADRSAVGRWTGHRDEVNDAVLRVAPGADPDAIADTLTEELPDALGGLGVTVTPASRDEVRIRIETDIKGDQQMYDLFALLVLGGAGIGTYNLMSRMVQAQRREIGIGMALGVPARGLARRPLATALAIGVIGAGGALPVARLVEQQMADLLATFQPMPVWERELDLGVYVVGIGAGLLVPLLGAVWPLWRALRLEPTEALRARHLTAGAGNRLNRHRHHARHRRHGHSLARLPFRNVVRARSRTLLTALALAAVISTMVAVAGMLDSFRTTIAIGEAEMLGDAPDRVTVVFDLPYPSGSDRLAVVPAAASVADAHETLLLPASLASPADLDAADEATRHVGEPIEALVEFADFDAAIWQPTVRASLPASAASDAAGGVDAGQPGIVLSSKAADDLGLVLGDDVIVSLPAPSGDGYRLAPHRLQIVGLHAVPLRLLAYVDERWVGVTGLEGFVDAFHVRPAPGATTDDVRRELFGSPGIASVSAVSDTTRLFRDLTDQFTGFLAVVEAFVALLALLLAVNVTSVTTEERRREHATMLAFGLPTRVVLRVMVIESFLVGVLGTLLGFAGGFVLIDWLVHVRAAELVPEIALTQDVSLTTIVATVLVGTVAVTLVPLLNAHRLATMDLPATLRVVE